MRSKLPLYYDPGARCPYADWESGQQAEPARHATIRPIQ